MSESYPVRTLREDDWPQVLEVDGHAFGHVIEPDLADLERVVAEPDRMVGAFDGDTLCGVAAAFSFDLAIPGAVVPAAGVSWVGVLPVYRRKGVLRGLMRHQLYDVRDRGREAIAILWASEPQIYGRFGYGLASRAYSVSVPRNAHALRPDAPQDPGLRLRLVAGDDWKVTAEAYDQVARSRPGLLARDARWHSNSVIDLPSRREGKSPLRCVVVEDAAGVRGYARYSTKPDWSTGQAAGTVHVREVIAVDGEALAALYAYLFDLDLMARTDLWNVPVDDPLLHWLTNIRAAAPRLQDALYVRILDVAGALAQRAYSTAIDTVIEVSDELCPWNAGRWRLTGGPYGARCEPVSDREGGGAADVSLAVADLGAAYLGGTTLHELCLAGRAKEGRPGALAAASAAFSWSPAPWCPVVF
jgi:predicted acetyltransferase